MKLLLLLIFFSITTFSQHSWITSNWDFQKKQLDKMLNLGYYKVNLSLTGKYNSTGKIFTTERTWQAYDTLGRFIQRGFRNGGMDTMTRTSYYSNTGKYLGEAYFDKEIKNNGYGREFVYDSNDSLIEVRNRKGEQVFSKYEYIVLNDSTILVKEYRDSVALGVKYAGSKKVIRTQNLVIFYHMKGEEILSEQKFEFDEYGQLTYLFQKNMYGIKEEFYQYNQDGKLISREWHSQQSYSDKFIRKMAWTYNSNSDLIKYELFEKGKIKEMKEYQFEGKLLIKEISTNYFPGWEEGYKFYFKYFDNGLMSSCSSYLEDEDITYTYKLTYE